MNVTSGHLCNCSGLLLPHLEYGHDIHCPASQGDSEREVSQQPPISSYDSQDIPRAAVGKRLYKGPNSERCRLGGGVMVHIRTLLNVLLCVLFCFTVYTLKPLTVIAKLMDGTQTRRLDLTHRLLPSPKSGYRGLW